MGRPAETPGKPLTVYVNTKMNLDMVAYIDSVKGPMSRAKYLRQLVRADAQRRKAGR